MYSTLQSISNDSSLLLCLRTCVCIVIVVKLILGSTYQWLCSGLTFTSKVLLHSDAVLWFQVFLSFIFVWISSIFCLQVLVCTVALE
uniref:Uncharacterized protein n=1 Tax=Anguilla anguilla TaxID=7936 RepID=A0A0E9WKG3_ANGAN